MNLNTRNKKLIVFVCFLGLLVPTVLAVTYLKTLISTSTINCPSEYNYCYLEVWKGSTKILNYKLYPSQELTTKLWGYKAVTCTAGYLDNYRCSGNWQQRQYQYTNCNVQWNNYQYCTYGCLNGICLPQSTTTTSSTTTITTIPTTTTSTTSTTITTTTTIPTTTTTTIPTGYCYQEFANASTICGGLNTGSYSSDIPTTLIDGDWNTYTSSGINQYQIRYTKPTNALPSSLWQVKFGTIETDVTIVNASIPIDCWNQNQLQFRTNWASGALKWECWNGVEWFVVRSKITLDVGTGGWYEEAIWWNLS